MSVSESRGASATVEAPTPVDVVRGLYVSLRVGDVRGILARLDPDVIVDEPLAPPYGGVHRGRDVLVGSVLGFVTSHAEVDVAKVAVFEGPDGVIGSLTGTLTARTNDETFPLTMVELHRVVGGTIREIDVYTENPELLAGFYARSSASSGAFEG